MNPPSRQKRLWIWRVAPLALAGAAVIVLMLVLPVADEGDAIGWDEVTTGYSPAERSATGDEQAPENRWPAALGGRPKRIETQQWVIYAKEAHAADSLHEWLDELEDTLAGGAGTSGTPRAPIAIVAIEETVEPDPHVLGWLSEKHRERNAGASGVGMDYRRWEGHFHGKYCLAESPYFSESYWIPVIDAVKSGLLEESHQEPGALCFVTTDSHFQSAFNDTVNVFFGEAAEESRGRAKDASQVLGDIAMGVMAMGVIQTDWRDRDSRLMRIQREEAIRRAMIDESELEPSAKKKAVQDLYEKTDMRWARIWEGRLVD